MEDAISYFKAAEGRGQGSWPFFGGGRGPLGRADGRLLPLCADGATPDLRPTDERLATHLPMPGRGTDRTGGGRREGAYGGIQNALT